VENNKIEKFKKSFFTLISGAAAKEIQYGTVVSGIYTDHTGSDRYKFHLVCDRYGSCPGLFL
jgi:hypothetical protein